MRSASENHGGSPMRFVSFRRPILTLRGGDQVHALLLDHNKSTAQVDSQLEAFQSKVAARFHDLSVGNGKDQFLSVSWIRKLLDAFSKCQDDFRLIIMSKKDAAAAFGGSKQPTERILTEYFDRTIKALDICNAARDGIEKIKRWQRHLEIVVCALGAPQTGGKTTVGGGNLRRARKALIDLALCMLEDNNSNKDSAAAGGGGGGGGGGVFSSHRSRSFIRRPKDQTRPARGRHARSLSWSVSTSWSASKQLQLLASSVGPPKPTDVLASNGLASLVHTMSFVLVFVLWVLVAGIPCQDRGVHTNIVIPRQCWGRPFHILQARIMEESKKRERRNSNGLVKEICVMEEGVSHLTELVDSSSQLSEQQMEELMGRVQELMSVCEVFKAELDPLERNLREVFRKIVSCRVDGLESLVNKGS
ncbi:unnamed protein product [Cuscuta epithymum]|uniref:Uncharacterized protein n=1 Tax=Cuscuta epithymum TaxID=186058 RepID=A0AAV0F563_9ASTE|nr:unnamed protein product [Cuscuta epithymum]